MENKDFAVFILTHGRPDNVKTYSTLIKSGYTGKIYFIIDNEDKSADQYIKNFGKDAVKIFDKKAMADQVDEGNNFDNRKVIIHARNASFDIAESLGITYFIQLDDDYTAFDFRIDTNSETDCGSIKPIKNIDKIFDLLLNYYKTIPALSIAFSQGGDFIGGINNGKGSYRFNKRKCMNSFICSVDRRFQFVGSINEDVNTYTTLQTRGQMFLTIPLVSLTQTMTQSNKGGMTDEYALTGTYVKSMHTVIMHPSGAKAAMMNANHKRIHHSISWSNTTAMVLDEKHKKLAELN
jgi:hypothetical protein